MMLEPIYSKEASEMLDRLETTADDALWESICDAIDLVCEQPGSAKAHAVALRVDDTTFWQVRISAPGEDRPWRLIWRPDGDRAVIAYIGV